jgi:hypothetical protein
VSGSDSSPADAELLASVESDLAFLEDEWDESIEEQSLRRSSTVLRNLLVYGSFGKAWRLAGERGEPEVEAPDLSGVLAGLNLAKVAFATAGGGVSGGVQVIGALVYLEAMTPEQIKERATRGPGPPQRRFKLSAFLASPAVVVEGATVSRQKVIQYIALKKGGAHPPDPSRRKDEEAYRLLDKVLDSYQVAEQRSVFFELLSIGQAVARSPDAKKLRALISTAD